MEKKLENLTNDELEVIRTYQDIYGYATEEEALQAAISEGSIVVEGSKMVFLPEGFKRLKLFTGHQKAAETKLNKALKKGKKEQLFEEDTFYLGTNISKDDAGEFVLDECTTTAVGENPEIVIIRIGYKGVRAAFDALGKPEATNFDSTVASNMFFEGQNAMLTKFGSVKSLLTDLKQAYPDGKTNKTQANVPANLKIRFKVVLFGLVKTPDGWEPFMYEATNRYNEKENLLTEWNKRDPKIPIVPQFISKLAITGADNFDNPIVQIIEPKGMSLATLKKDLGEDVSNATRAVAKFISDAQTYLESTNTAPKTTEADKAPVAEDDDDEISFD